ncbi:unnamed protein product [Kuraishia capsulata CBS 1993]|uniref:Ornithine aminotransferase n=1 Tax=Kuraishia capsulata CBS 1993 TaxID=1382522 RepID=W6MN25_9ASCO|nr:uncharacterized protein KUCA_T00003971001 [Kuraishia capsulata CBS 1993]CDK27991.1 unnamed protein product [Kuraishia capsulata CBS 1993]
MSDYNDVSQETLKAVAEYHEHTRGGFLPLPIPIVKAQDYKLWDSDGKEYLDFLSMFAVVNMGHSHPKIVSAMVKAIQDRALVNTAFVSPSYAALAAKIHQIFGYNRCVAMLSGADATDTATKIARKWGYKVKGITAGKAFVLTTSSCYHGLTISTHSFTSSKDENFGPFVPFVGYISPSGIPVEYGDLTSLEKALEKDHETIAAFMVEPIQGAAGIIDPPEGYFKAAFSLCKKFNVLFIADEVQTGLGRAGYVLKSWSSGVQPDLVCLGKAIAGGMTPLSIVMGNNSVMDLIEKGDIGSTFGATPPATESALAALSVLIDEDLATRSLELGKLMRKLVQDQNLPQIETLTGEGLLCAAVLKNPSERFNARRLAALCATKGLVIGPIANSRVRLCPPLTIKEYDLRRAVEIFAQSCRELESIDGPIIGIP